MKTITGNLLDQAPGVLCHQVNTLGVMGGGLALQIRQKWPSVYARYRFACSNGHLHLGAVQILKVADAIHVANMAGQDTIGIGECLTSYQHYPVMLKSVRDYAEVMEVPLYFPYLLGCGLAGGDWNIMLPLLEKHCPDATIVKWSGQ